MPESFSQPLIAIPWAIVQLALFIRIDFHHPFHFTENHFHKNGLGACPTTKHPAIDHGKQVNKNYHGYHAYAEDEKILRPEDETKNRKLSFYHIYLQCRIAVHFNKRQCKKQHYIQYTQNSTPGVPFSLGLPCINPVPFSFFGYRWHPVAKRLF